MSKQENQLQKQTKNSTEFSNRVEGKEALDRLEKALSDKGLLVDPEQESQSTNDLLDRVTKLENEVSVLKDLIVRALKVDTGKVLKD